MASGAYQSNESIWREVVGDDLYEDEEDRRAHEELMRLEEGGDVLDSDSEVEEMDVEDCEEFNRRRRQQLKKSMTGELAVTVFAIPHIVIYHSPKESLFFSFQKSTLFLSRSVSRKPPFFSHFPFPSIFHSSLFPPFFIPHFSLHSPFLTFPSKLI